MDSNFTTHPPIHLPTYLPTHVPTNPCSKVLLLATPVSAQDISHPAQNPQVHHHLVIKFYWILHYFIPFWSLCTPSTLSLNTAWQPELPAPNTTAVRWLPQCDDYQMSALFKKYSCNKLEHICQFSCFLVKESGGGGGKSIWICLPPPSSWQTNWFGRRPYR